MFYGAVSLCTPENSAMQMLSIMSLCFHPFIRVCRGSVGQSRLSELKIIFKIIARSIVLLLQGLHSILLKRKTCKVVLLPFQGTSQTSYYVCILYFFLAARAGTWPQLFPNAAVLRRPFWLRSQWASMLRDSQASTCGFTKTPQFLSAC